MECWIKKDIAIACAKSIAAKGRLERMKDYGNEKWINGSLILHGIQKGQKPGQAFVEFTPCLPTPPFKLQIPTNNILVRHKAFSHPVLLSNLDMLKKLVYER